MGNLCGGGSKQHDVDNRNKRTGEGQLNPLSAHHPTAPAPVRQQADHKGGPPAATGAAAAAAGMVGGSGTVAEVEQWYNDMIRLLWPFINPAVTKMCNEMLPPLLEQSKPTWMTRLELTKFELGKNPLVLTNLSVREGPDPGHDDIFLDFDFKWDAPNLDVELAVNPLPKFVAGIPGIKQATSITVGVEDFYLEGRVRISMVPILKEIPVVGAIQISLLGMPRFDMNLTLGVFDGLEGVIKPWLKSFIEDFVLEAYQVPGHYFLPLANGIPDVQTPAGVLELTVVEAVNVPKMDYLSQSSPYCKLWLTGAKKNAVKTPYVDSTKNPKWDPQRSTFGIPVHAPDHQQLVVSLYDYDFGSADDEIGRTTISIKDLGDEQPQDFWVSFESAEQKKAEDQKKEKQEQGASVKDTKHMDQNGHQKGILQRAQDAVVHAVVPAAGGHDKQLPACRVRIKAVYHSLDESDVRRLNEAQDARRPVDASMIREGPTRRAVEKFGLMDQIVGTKKDAQGATAQSSGTGANASANQGGQQRGGGDSAEPQGGQGAQGAGGNVPRGGAGGVATLGGASPGQAVGAFVPGQNMAQGQLATGARGGAQGGAWSGAGAGAYAGQQARPQGLGQLA